MVIYTKRGDKGETSLYDEGSAQRLRVSKASLSVETLGAIDELNSFLGIVAAFNEDSKFIKTVKEIQANLLTIGSVIAGSKLNFPPQKTKDLELLIDGIEGKLPPLKNFIFPGGGKSGSLVHYARSLTRKAERLIVALNAEEKLEPSILTYINRLSDALFMLARKLNTDLGIGEEVWKGSAK